MCLRYRLNSCLTPPKIIVTNSDPSRVLCDRVRIRLLTMLRNKPRCGLLRYQREPEGIDSDTIAHAIFVKQVAVPGLTCSRHTTQGPIVEGPETPSCCLQARYMILRSGKT